MAGPAPDAPSVDGEAPDTAVPSQGGAITSNRVTGLIPTGWYPTAVQVARTGREIYVANAQGARRRSESERPQPLHRHRPTRDAGVRRRVHRVDDRRIAVYCAYPNRDQLTSYTTQDTRNNGADQVTPSAAH